MQVKLPIAPPAIVTSQAAQKHPCDWKECQKHPDDINPNYPRKGSTAKGKATSGSDYETEWIDEKLEPWESRGPGVDPKCARQDFQHDLCGSEPPKPKNLVEIDKGEVLAKQGQYNTQKHHVISTHLIPKYPAIEHNAKLMTYNINDAGNGLCLPYFTQDIVRHDLQCHRGPHPPAYDASLDELLANLEIKCKTYCQSGMQTKLDTKLHEYENHARARVLDWQNGWYLRTSACSERAAAYARLGLTPPKRGGC